MLCNLFERCTRRTRHVQVIGDVVGLHVLDVEALPADVGVRDEMEVQVSVNRRQNVGRGFTSTVRVNQGRVFV